MTKHRAHENENTRPPISRVYADERTGLSDEFVKERIENGYANTPVDSPSKTVKQIILSNVFTFFNLIFIVLAIALIAVGSFKELTFLVVVVANTLICIIQEINAKKTLDKLNLLNAPTARVVRDGRECITEVSGLVLDDIVVLTSGDQIVADGVVISGEVSVNEALITGESDEITKRDGDGLLSGSFVVSGKCYARLTRVGADSFVSRLTLEAKKLKKREDMGMMKSLTSLIKVIGIMIVPVAAFLFINQYKYLDMGIKESIEKTTAALIGMIPEGLYLLTSIALAVSVVRLAKKQTLVHEMGCIETLARVDTLCVDKTGTITEPEMKVCDVVPLKADISFLEQVLVNYAHSMGNDNNTILAIKAYFESEENIKSNVRQFPMQRAERVVPFSSVYKYSGVRYTDGKCFIMGAPEFIIKNDYGVYKNAIERYAREGKRVVLIGSYSGELNGEALTEDVVPLGLVALSNPIRQEAKETFGYFREQGVKVKVISGDNPVTVSSAAEQAGIDDYDSYVDMSSIHNDTELEEAANKYTVFGRVTPEQKKKLIMAMKKQGHKVAMTGDGVNDVLALKEADCSIAMASGSDVASRVAQLVLLNSDFSAMPSVVAEGRRVINNIERSAALFLVKNIFSFIMAWVTIFAVFEYPLQPSQLTMINIFTIGAPSFILALEPNKNRVSGRFLPNVLLRALPAGLTDFVLILFAVLFSVAFNIESAMISTVAAILMAVVGFIMLFDVCKPFNWLRITLFASMAVGFIISYYALGSSLFSMANINFGCVLILIVLMLLAYPVMHAIKLGLKKLGEIIGVLIKKINER